MNEERAIVRSEETLPLELVVAEPLGRGLVVPPFDTEAFRALTKRVIAAEKPGFWSDWTEEGQRLYRSGDWKAFSRSRGYSEEEIAECEQWLSMIEQGQQLGLNPYALIGDLAAEMAARNIARDTRGEILLSSHLPVRLQRRATIHALEEWMQKFPQVEIPVAHAFSKGIYSRTILIPKGTILTGELHRHECLSIVSSGAMLVATETGNRKVIGPCAFASPPGTKRIGIALSDCLWTTVHPNPDDERDTDKLEEHLFTKEYDDPELLEELARCALQEAKEVAP
jgi:hypothetical protein